MRKCPYILKVVQVEHFKYEYDNEGKETFREQRFVEDARHSNCLGKNAGLMGF